MNGEPLLPDHGYPVRLVLPGWVGIASIKWLGSLEVADTELTSPWNTKWYRMTGGSYPADSPPLTINPVRSAWELAWGATLARRAGDRAHRPLVERRRRGRPGRRQHRRRRDLAAGAPVPLRAPPGLDPVALRVEEARPRPARADGPRHRPAGRTQPLVTPYNDNGYFFDAVVRHPVTVV